MTGPIRSDDRGISKEAMAAIGFGLTILMMAVTGGLLMQTSDNLSDGGPILSIAAEPIETADDSGGLWVRLKHKTGDTVAVSNLTVQISLPDHRKQATLHSLPTNAIRQSDYDGNHIFKIGKGGISGVASSNSSDERWSAGDEMAFRFSDRRILLQKGQTVEITVRHTGEEKVLYEETLTVTS